MTVELRGDNFLLKVNRQNGGCGYFLIENCLLHPTRLRRQGQEGW